MLRFAPLCIVLFVILAGLIGSWRTGEAGGYVIAALVAVIAVVFKLYRTDGWS